MTKTFDEKAELVRWQRRLLPWAIGLLFSLAIFFLGSSWIQFDRLSTALQRAPDDQISKTFQAYEASGAQQDLTYLQWKTRVLLERNTVQNRYGQVNATLLLKTWTRHIGFLTGMILSFIGGIFILTKLSENETQIGAESAGLKGSLATSSPGIVLTVVGGVIMIVTIVVEYHFTTTDTPAYLGGAVPVAAAPDDPPLPMLENPADRETEDRALFNSEAEEGEK